MSRHGPDHPNYNPRCDEMAAAVAAGETLQAVGLRFGVSAVAVFKACQRRGVRSTRPNPRKERLS